MFKQRPITVKEETFKDKVFFWKNVPVCITRQLAEFYGTSSQVITNNFNRNKDRFKVSDHFFRLSGRQIVDFTGKNHLDFNENTPSLILWTKRGAVRHAKILTTDQAWDVWEVLEKEYFEKNTKTARQIVDDILSTDVLLSQQSVATQKRNSNQINAENVYAEETFNLGRRAAIAYNQRNCMALTDRSPATWRQQGRELGLPNNVLRSAKAVARVTDPELACVRSLADILILEGADETLAFEVARSAETTFRLMNEMHFAERFIARRMGVLEEHSQYNFLRG